MKAAFKVDEWLTQSRMLFCWAYSCPYNDSDGGCNLKGMSISQDGMCQNYLDHLKATVPDEPNPPYGDDLDPISGMGNFTVREAEGMGGKEKCPSCSRMTAVKVFPEEDGSAVTKDRAWICPKCFGERQTAVVKSESTE